jgi:hypothetical protein
MVKMLTQEFKARNRRRHDRRISGARELLAIGAVTDHCFAGIYLSAECNRNAEAASNVPACSVTLKFLTAGARYRD